MEKNIKQLLEETEKLKKENTTLLQQLQEMREYANVINKANIDALVISNEKDLDVYTKNAADKIYRILIEKMHEGAVTLNKDGTILYCNSYFATMVNLPLQKLIGTKFENFIGDSLKEQFETLFKQTGEYSTKKEIYIYTNDGKGIPVLMSVTILPVNNDFILSIILTDLTIQNRNQEELKRRTSQLEQKNIELKNVNEDLTSFTYLSSHDLQEPLRKIQNFASCILLEEEKNLSETGKGYFQRMRLTAKRMQALIEDLLVFSRTKNSERIFEMTDLGVIIDEVKNDLEEVIQEKAARIDAVSLCEVNIIRFQFRQLMYNLVSNSLKFSNPQTTPHIIIKSAIVEGSRLKNEHPAFATYGLTTTMNYCHISYTDNGIGFDSQYNERIFEVFQRLHSQEEYKGTGMGLAICKRIIENHHGFITASGKVDKGARFDIYIPAP